MAQQIADRRDIDFVLYEQLNADNLAKHERFEGMNRKMFDMIINEARNFAIKEILPVNEEGDKEGLVFENNQVKVPKCFHRPYKLLKEGEWIAMTEDPEVGGQGLPAPIAQAALEYIIGADFSFSAFAFATHGAAKMIEVFGTEKQKELYLKKMYSGEWTGTMVLTEPEAGSDLGALTTKAVKNDDGSYQISGNKIFITCGEHDLTDNIIHPVLARIEGEPEGTKGISLFIVPKVWVNDDGSLGEKNDVVCTGIEEKLGLHASPTCQLTFGGKGQCRGVLLGDINKGMRVMFHMMNEARLGVGAIGLFNASCAYLYAINYAKERVQGRDLKDMLNKKAPSVSIINHPDVRRMLLWMKSHVEGMRSFVYYVSDLFEREACAENDDQKTYWGDLIELLTPIIKSYCTDRGFECTVQAMQIYGGYGYTKDYPIERLMRDSKINSIYEGTNGIQAMDLLGRKIGMKKGTVFMNLLSEISKVIKVAKENEVLSPLAEKMENAVNRFGETAMHLGTAAMSEKFKAAFGHASQFLEVSGDIIMGWMLLWRANVASSKLESLLGDISEEARVKKINTNKNAAFYQGQLSSAQYFIETILPITLGKMDSIKGNSSAVVDIPEVSFGG
ncbi:Acyl-CoA oxidase/dehydrogenase, type 1 domain protein [Candidatus Magnetomorum sp. HK-1]|nr:Acyl-CoA oxidase/dehydrogenase, type 1 domain protein [Candidatus Magnetomorum sp. HK-1]